LKGKDGREVGKKGNGDGAGEGVVVEEERAKATKGGDRGEDEGRRLSLVR